MITAGTKESIHIVFSPNESYAVHAGVAMRSILLHAVDPSRFEFYFMEGDEHLSNENRRRLASTSGPYGARLTFVPIDAGKVNVYDRWGPRYITVEAYNRLLVPEVLPQLDRCLYLDCDLVVLDDLAELWDMNVPEVAVAGVRDCYVDRENLKKYQPIKIYFNSGVLLMNLRLWRERGYVEKFFALATDPELHKRFADQDLLNIVFSQDVYILHSRWNIQTGQKPIWRGPFLKNDWREWREICQKPKIAHFTGERKPWNMEMKHDWSLEYWRVLAMTPWAEEIKNFQRKMFIAQGYRGRALIVKMLRWLITVKKNKADRILKVSICGRLFVDQRNESCPYWR